MSAFDAAGLERIDRQLVRAAIPALGILALLWFVLTLVGAVPVAFGVPILVLDLLLVAGFYVAHRVVQRKLREGRREAFRR